MDIVILVMLFTAVSAGLFVGGLALFLVEGAAPVIQTNKRVAAVARSSALRNSVNGKVDPGGDVAAKRRKQTQAAEPPTHHEQPVGDDPPCPF